MISLLKGEQPQSRTHLGRRLHLLHRRAQATVGNVVEERVVEEARVLGHHADQRTDRGLRQPPDVAAGVGSVCRCVGVGVGGLGCVRPRMSRLVGRLIYGGWCRGVGDGQRRRGREEGPVRDGPRPRPVRSVNSR